MANLGGASLQGANLKGRTSKGRTSKGRTLQPRNTMPRRSGRRDTTLPCGPAPNDTGYPRAHTTRPPLQRPRPIEASVTPRSPSPPASGPRRRRTWTQCKREGSSPAGSSGGVTSPLSSTLPPGRGTSGGEGGRRGDGGHGPDMDSPELREQAVVDCGVAKSRRGRGPRPAPPRPPAPAGSAGIRGTWLRSPGRDRALPPPRRRRPCAGSRSRARAGTRKIRRGIRGSRISADHAGSIHPGQEEHRLVRGPPVARLQPAEHRVPRRGLGDGAFHRVPLAPALLRRLVRAAVDGRPRG